MIDARQPNFATALLAVLAGSAVSAWFAAAAVGVAPETNVEAWAILTSLVGAVGLKLALRVLRYSCPFAFAAGALLAAHVAGLALAQAMPDLDHLVAGFPGLVLATFVVQVSAAHRRAPADY
jgi:hypothetical protein